MKNSMLALFMSFLGLGSAIAQQGEELAIKQTIENFAKAGDRNDVTALEQTLDANYRIVMNRLFGSTEVAIMTRAAYLKKIETKEYGGDQRTVVFQEIAINGSVANAKVTLSGKQANFSSLFTLVKDENGKWKLVQDVPVMI